MEIKVRFRDTDMLGHVNHASYLTYMEEARLEFLKKIGIEVKSTGYTIVLVGLKVDYMKQGYFGQILDVSTTISKVGRTSFTLINHIVEKESNELITKAEVTIVYYDIDNEKSVEIPDALKDKLKEHLISE